MRDYCIETRRRRQPWLFRSAIKTAIGERYDMPNLLLPYSGRGGSNGAAAADWVHVVSQVVRSKC